MKKILSLTLAILLILAVMPIGTITAGALTSGNYTYTVSNGAATITDCNTSVSGSITIPATIGGYPVTTIGSEAFKNCTNLTSATIGNNVTTINRSVFANCTALTSVVIGGSVKSIGTYIFENCTSLVNITVGTTNTNYSSSDGVLFNKGKTKLISYPAGKSSATYAIPSTITSLENYAFAYAKGITSMTIPDNVTTIGRYVFVHCENITGIKISKNVNSIGYASFFYCPKLQNITVDANNENYCSVYGKLFNADKTQLICFPAGQSISEYSVPNSVESIYHYAFAGAANLTSVTIGSGVTSIGEYAFADCTGLKSIKLSGNITAIKMRAFSACTSLESIIIPNGVTELGNDAFWNCTALASIYIPKTLTKIGNFTFSRCSNLKTVYYCGTEDQWAGISIGSSNDYLTKATVVYHDYQATTVKPTCTKDGYTVHTCSFCGDKYVTDEVSATGHSFGEWTTRTESGCITEGEEYRICSVCGVEETNVKEAIGHNYVSKVTTPDCTNNGYTTHTCEYCGDTYTDSITSALGHNYNATVTNNCVVSREGTITRRKI